MRVAHASIALAALLLTTSHVSRADRLLPPLPIPMPQPAALEGEWIQSFDDLGFVAPPIGSTDPRPVVVAAHGMGDRPEWECAAWRGIFGPRPFIVCPRGDAWVVNFKWRSSSQVRAAADALLDAAQARYGAHLDRDHRVYAGFSQGAILGAKVVRDDPHHYPYAVFQEGFDDALVNRPLDDALHKSGLLRVLLGCSQGGCVGRRAPLVTALSHSSVDARVNYAGQRGHTIDDTVVRSVRRDLPWLLAGDDVWRDVALDAANGS